MVIFLTGVAGFIGSHLAEQLLAVGHKVIGFDNLDDQYDPALKQQNINLFIDHPCFHFVPGDIRDQELVTRTIRQYQCDTVVHLAARAGVRSSVREPTRSIDVNVNGTLAVLEAMRINKIRRLVMASSSSVYGNSPCVPFREDDEVGTPLSPYAMSKRSAELLAHTYHHLYKMDISCLRFFTVYGPRQRPEMAISHFTDQLIHFQPITLFGDGTTARNYTYIHDTVMGILRAIYHLKDYNVLNIAGPSSISLRDLVRVIEECVGHQAVINWEPAQPGDVDLTCADLTRAADLIGYRPTINLREGLKRYVAWYRQSLLQERTLVV